MWLEGVRGRSRYGQCLDRKTGARQIPSVKRNIIAGILCLPPIVLTFSLSWIPCLGMHEAHQSGGPLKPQSTVAPAWQLLSIVRRTCRGGRLCYFEMQLHKMIISLSAELLPSLPLIHNQYLNLTGFLQAEELQNTFFPF